MGARLIRINELHSDTRRKSTHSKDKTSNRFYWLYSIVYLLFKKQSTPRDENVT